MKYVMIVPPIALVDPKTQKRIKQVVENGPPEDMPPTSHKGWTEDNLTNDTKMGKGGDGIRRSIRIEEAFLEENLKTVNGKQYAAIESDDYKKAKEILDNMDWQMLRLNKQYYPFVKAWEDATDELPKEEVKSNGQQPATSA